MSLMLGQLICLPAEYLINHLLKQDPAAIQQLTRWQGHRCLLDVQGLICISITSGDGAVHLSLLSSSESNQWPDADVVLSGQVSDFFALAMASDKANELINSQVDMSGNTNFAMAMTRLVQNLDIDWEALLSPLTGSLAAHQLGLSARKAKQWSEQTGQSYSRAVKSYLEDEAEYIAPKPLVDYFNQQMDELRLKTDRLEARVAHLEQQHQRQLDQK